MLTDDYDENYDLDDFYNDADDYWFAFRKHKPHTKEPFHVEDRLFLKDIKEDTWYETYNSEFSSVTRTFQVIEIKDETLEVADRLGNRYDTYHSDNGLAPYDDGLWNPVNYTRLATSK